MKNIEKLVKEDIDALKRLLTQVNMPIIDTNDLTIIYF